MRLSNTATPKYYKIFRDAVLRGDIPVCENISMEMNRIDRLIKNPNYYYDEEAVEKWIRFCEHELTLTDGQPLHLLDSFKLWGEEIFGWYCFVERSVYEPYSNRKGGHYVKKVIKKRLVNKQFLIVGRGAAKSLYDTCIQGYFLICDTETSQQVTAAPTVKQSDEVLAPLRTAITKSPGPLFKFLTQGSLQSTSNSALRPKLYSSKKGIENKLTNSILESRPMTIDKFQGMRCKVVTIDEWLSGDTREDVTTAAEQGASKLDDYLIIESSSEGVVRNGPGDGIKMELMKILKGEYQDDHTSIFWYTLDDISEVGDPYYWVKAQPNIGITVTYETYQRDVDKAENSPTAKNEILAKRFGIPSEGYTYFFTYEETKVHPYREYWQMPCVMGADLSKGGDFCAFVFLFPLNGDAFGIKCLNFISEYTLDKLPGPLRVKYDEFINEGSLIVLNGTVLDMDTVYEEVDSYITKNEYSVNAFGYDPYNAKIFVTRYTVENSEYGVEKVIQGAKTESVPLTEIKKLAEQGLLLFDQSIMSYTMGNCITIKDTNGNLKLYKMNYEAKIDDVAALMDAFVAYKLNKDNF